MMLSGVFLTLTVMFCVQGGVPASGRRLQAGRWFAPAYAVHLLWIGFLVTSLCWYFNQSNHFICGYLWPPVTRRTDAGLACNSSVTPEQSVRQLLLRYHKEKALLIWLMVFCGTPYFAAGYEHEPPRFSNVSS